MVISVGVYPEQVHKKEHATFKSENVTLYSAVSAKWCRIGLQLVGLLVTNSRTY